MIIYKGQNGSITERKSPIRKIRNLSQKKINNNIHLYKRKSFIIKKNDNYKRKTINVDDNEFIKKVELNIRKNKAGNKFNNKNLKLNLKDIQNYNRVNNNKNFKGNSKLLLDSDRCDKTTREKYLSKFFKTKGIEINKINKEKNNDIYNTIREDSKINKFSRNNINNSDNNQKFNKSYIIGNEPMNNLKHELNYEYEIRLLNKKLKTLQKTNNK